MNSVIFNFAQSFFVDPQSVKDAKEVDLSSVDLYFKEKPRATGNKSGIENPGVSIFICEIDANKNPNVMPYLGGVATSIAKVAYPEIVASADASGLTKFKFDRPVRIKTGIEYAVVGIFDGNENFSLWSSKQGDILLGSNKPSPGPSGKYVGSYYNSIVISTQDLSSGVDETKPLSIIASWRPSSDTDLKFNVNIARYSVNGVPVGNSSMESVLPVNSVIYAIQSDNSANIVYGSNGVTYKVAAAPYEYIVYDKKKSRVGSYVFAGELVYQNTVFYPGGAANGLSIAVSKGSKIITANTLYPNGAAFSWNDIYGSSQNDEYIVVVSQNGSTRKTDIRRVETVISNTVLQVEVACGFTNAAAYFIKSPVAKIELIDKTRSFDYKATTAAGRKTRVKQDLLVLKDSNANATHRFVNTTINSVSISANGTGYSNSDYVVITGYENGAEVTGGYVAKANLVVNATTGAIRNVYLSNVGAGFSNSANITYTIYNTLGQVSSGVSATLAFTTGAVIRSEYDGRSNNDDSSWGTDGIFSDCNVINMEFYHFTPGANSVIFAGALTSLQYYTPFYATYSSGTYLGVSYHLNADANVNRKTVQKLEQNLINYKNTPVLVSRSNEFVIIDDVTNTVNSTPTPGSGILEVSTSSNNDFVSVSLSDIALTYGKFNVNNDYAKENTDYGNAASKHITKKISFASDRFAEDLLVYLTAYRPLNTDIKVFARLHNSKDPEAFDDKDWTMLELKSSNIYSSSASTDNFIEMQFGFQNSPNTAYLLPGTVTVDNTTTTNVTGSGTTFSSNATSNVQVNDLVKIYSPLFPNNYTISVVSAVASDTQFSIHSPVNNTNVTGSGLKVAFIGRVGNSTLSSVGYPLQAFNNRDNDNVVRYYSSSMMEFDTYDTLQLKIVFLADVGAVSSATANVIPTNIPRVDDIRAVGVTA